MLMFFHARVAIVVTEFLSENYAFVNGAFRAQRFKERSNFSITMEPFL